MVFCYVGNCLLDTQLRKFLVGRRVDYERQQKAESATSTCFGAA